MSSTTHRGSSTGFAAIAVGAVIWLDAILVRLLFRADESSVWILGHKLADSCALRTHFGLPCPTCGLTRSAVLALHGEWSLAWQIAPVGPFAAAGLLGFATLLLLLPIARRFHSHIQFGTIRTAALLYAASTVVLWICGWALQFRAALH